MQYTASTSDLKKSLGKVIKLVLIVDYMVITTPAYNFLRNFGHLLLQISNILYFSEIVADKQRVVQTFKLKLALRLLWTNLCCEKARSTLASETGTPNRMFAMVWCTGKSLDWTSCPKTSLSKIAVCSDSNWENRSEHNRCWYIEACWKIWGSKRAACSLHCVTQAVTFPPHSSTSLLTLKVSSLM